ncbi:FKBP-type peptidyl-prolyl cis-trans isomerase [Chlamydiifrater phoenicopteri]|uniref:FKBP-type peptidyl-prolyl cis-trans isomerase n=1 Tax=Chlamydiifrater phoenicopteri TaxID=2681469 RepID=UPI001BCD8B64|nr:FKBP-type peptidyl-prolyl cis-trans isomerase [Chlamydiifrater phoenicopteri]
MKKLWGLVIAGLLVLVTSCSSKSSIRTLVRNLGSEGKDTVVEKTVSQGKEQVEESKKLSRTFGHLLARQLSKSEDITFDLIEVAKGMQDEMSNKEAPLSQTEYEERMTILQKEVFERKSSENLLAAEKFLKDNAKNTNVIEVQENLLQYKIIEQGSGEVLKGTPTALLHYQGKFVDGKIFSSSYDLKEPILLPLHQTIKGFALGMQGMREGEKRELYIHPSLAYGTTGSLPPNSLLIFEIELIKVNGEEVAAIQDEKAETPAS